MAAPSSRSTDHQEQVARGLRLRHAILAVYDALTLLNRNDPYTIRRLNSAIDHLIDLAGPGPGWEVIAAMMYITERSELLRLERAIIKSAE
jgi:hypothetical protein